MTKMLLDRAIALTLMSFDRARSEGERDELRREALALTQAIAPA